MEFPGPDDVEENQDGIERSDDDLYEPYSKLIPIFYQGKEYMVPENNTLLRVLQYLNPEVAYGNYCWNGDCRNCMITIRRSDDSQEVTAVGCLTKAVPGLQIIRLPLGVRIQKRPQLY
ncbi:MAG TPA: 2Fe-2S iron-sulfur cluster-binding protein [Acidobacteriota bacterium]|nr:2Fe-2S iron-sulfur cluster-binding protein [Acidobacteriota bacterium]